MALTSRLMRSKARGPWIKRKGKAKAYHVRQVLLAVDKLEGIRNER